MDIKSVIRDYSYIKPILVVRPERRDREEIRTVYDMEIREILCVF